MLQFSLFSHSVVSNSLQSHDCSTPGFPVHHQLPELLKLMSIKSVMPSNHLILCRHFLFLPSIFPSIRVFSMSQFFASGGQSIGVSASASVLPIHSFKKFISHSSFLLERPNYTSGIQCNQARPLWSNTECWRLSSQRAPHLMYQFQPKAEGLCECAQDSSLFLSQWSAYSLPQFPRTTKNTVFATKEGFFDLHLRARGWSCWT